MGVITEDIFCQPNKTMQQNGWEQGYGALVFVDHLLLIQWKKFNLGRLWGALASCIYTERYIDIFQTIKAFECLPTSIHSFLHSFMHT